MFIIDFPFFFKGQISSLHMVQTKGVVQAGGWGREPVQRPASWEQGQYSCRRHLCELSKVHLCLCQMPDSHRKWGYKPIYADFKNTTISPLSSIKQASFPDPKWCTTETNIWGLLIGSLGFLMGVIRIALKPAN